MAVTRRFQRRLADGDFRSESLNAKTADFSTLKLRPPFEQSSNDGSMGRPAAQYASGEGSPAVPWLLDLQPEEAIAISCRANPKRGRRKKLAFPSTRSGSNMIGLPGLNVAVRLSPWFI